MYTFAVSTDASPQKSNLTTQFILEMLSFQEFCNLSDWLGTFWVITPKQ